MTYVDATEMSGYLRNTIIADEDEIAGSLAAAVTAINAYCYRTFAVPSSATARLFVADDCHVLTVPDIANNSGLIIVADGVTLAAADYQLEIFPGQPGQVTAEGRTVPYRYIRRVGGEWRIPRDGVANLTITASWGWPAVPDDVKLATKLLARDYLLARDTGFGITQVGDFSRRVTENSVVAGLLGPLRRAEAFGLA